jgi:hypothetical protein
VQSLARVRIWLEAEEGGRLRLPHQAHRKLLALESVFFLTFTDEFGVSMMRAGGKEVGRGLLRIHGGEHCLDMG